MSVLPLCTGSEDTFVCHISPFCRALKRLSKPNLRAEVFEYDNRFAAFGSDFHFFDYKAPLEVQ